MIMSIDKEDANNDCDDMRYFNHYYNYYYYYYYYYYLLFLLLPLTKMLSQKP